MNNTDTVGGDKISSTLDVLIAWVSAIGGSVLTLLLLVIGIFIMFSSLSAQMKRVAWVAFFSCLGGAAVFFLAFVLSDSMKVIFGPAAN